MRAANINNAKNNTDPIASAYQNQDLLTFKHETEPGNVVNKNDETSTKHHYFGKCQYKTGKCFNERTLKRNGEAHSLCEEHRIKQNMIQRRSDRKYQTVHAIRRRERSQRRAVLKKQVSMAVAQQLFYEHQQQKTLGIPLPQHHPLHLLTVNAKSDASAVSGGSLSIEVPIQSPLSPLAPHSESGGAERTTAFHCLANASTKVPLTAVKDSSTYKSVFNSSPCSFLGIAVPLTHSLTTLQDQMVVRSKASDSLGYVPPVSCLGDKEAWSDDDIEFLHTVLLT
ncbi:uncharacterized protein PHALS_12077 [Plasmopara halstedii]|uniref:Uncharacterized protein n=1 Tax=Plasmopara halstedii TaxID=4781 RepID=A0A0P1AM65_PLAHL|nr:uncharacterized protein PHALS_12077 [Plasmopara halstedii]CEG41748.1 hypothetical protein PHALS_12077 [Plasmopara halstedii]|eukprot:XP_024578117.1 hypothetical protein PHALS_12077 [Plasmopara halstedii]